MGVGVAWGHMRLCSNELLPIACGDMVQVCGSDGVTYHDVATLRAQGGNVRVDYRGPCEDVESDEDDTPATRCQMVRSRNMCSNITGCDRMVMPSDGCCPVCGKYFKLTVQSLYIWTSWGWVLCPLWRGCPLLRGNKCTITMGSGTLWSEVSSSQR